MPEKFTNKEISLTYFKLEKQIIGEKNQHIGQFQCRCGIKRSQDLAKGYQNLISHIKTEHLDYLEVMQSRSQTGQMDKFRVETN